LEVPALDPAVYDFGQDDRLVRLDKVLEALDTQRHTLSGDMVTSPDKGYVSLARAQLKRGSEVIPSFKPQTCQVPISDLLNVGKPPIEFATAAKRKCLMIVNINNRAVTSYDISRTQEKGKSGPEAPSAKQGMGR
jgi:hypothetical protein